MRRVVRQPKRPPAKKEKTAGPTAESKRRLLQFAQAGEVFQAGIRRLPKWLDAGGGAGVIPWVVLVACQTTGLIVSTELLAEEPSAELLWDILTKKMQQRPARVLVKPDARWDQLATHLNEVGIEIETGEKLEFLDELFADMVKKTRRTRGRDCSMRPA